MKLLQPLWAENQPYSTELRSGAFEMSLGKISQNKSTQSTDKGSGRGLAEAGVGLNRNAIGSAAL